MVVFINSVAVLIWLIGTYKCSKDTAEDCRIAVLRRYASGNALYRFLRHGEAALRIQGTGAAGFSIDTLLRRLSFH